MVDLFEGLTAIVQYRRKDGAGWLNMAAFDVGAVAQKYATDCGNENSPWEYRVIFVPEDEDDIGARWLITNLTPTSPAPKASA